MVRACQEQTQMSKPTYEQLIAALRELADECESEIRDRYRQYYSDGDGIHPAMQGRLDRDLSVVRNARELIAGLTPNQ
jgi:hypothetical protein